MGLELRKMARRSARRQTQAVVTNTLVEQSKKSSVEHAVKAKQSILHFLYWNYFSSKRVVILQLLSVGIIKYSCLVNRIFPHAPQRQTINAVLALHLRLDCIL